nr:U11/U12 small nuclear ribonucleoprotein 48 kDa protein [Tanacetum cinerariifolium]
MENDGAQVMDNNNNKSIHVSRFVLAYQRVQEHQYITKLAEAGRKKHSDYRPTIKHDGVLWHQRDNQDENKNKL